MVQACINSERIYSISLYACNGIAQICNATPQACSILASVRIDSMQICLDEGRT